MKRPDKSDIDAHRAWTRGVAKRLFAARHRHPYLVLRAMQWFMRSMHSKGDAANDYIPLHAFKPVLAFIGRSLHAAYGCTCDLNCACGRTPKLTPDNYLEVFGQMARWIRVAASKGWST